jgi:hypothetical protein
LPSGKIYDRKCPGLYVSIITAGVATFTFKFTDPETGKQRTGWLGVYNPETFTVEVARRLSTQFSRQKYHRRRTTRLDRSTDPRKSG